LVVGAPGWLSNYQFLDEKMESQKGSNSLHNHSTGKIEGPRLKPSFCLLTKHNTTSYQTQTT